MSVDGGGTKALATIEILKRMEQLTQKSVHESFDLVAGTSTGAILALALSVYKMSLEEVERMYMELSQQVFGVRWRMYFRFFVGSLF